MYACVSEACICVNVCVWKIRRGTGYGRCWCQHKCRAATCVGEVYVYVQGDVRVKESTYMCVHECVCGG